MTKDEIAHVLRLTAMGRLNTPAQEEFCEKLERVFAGPAPAQESPANQPADEPTAPRKRAKKA